MATRILLNSQFRYSKRVPQPRNVIKRHGSFDRKMRQPSSEDVQKNHESFHQSNGNTKKQRLNVLKPKLPVASQPSQTVPREDKKSSPMQSVHSERLKWKKRKFSESLPLVIVNFQGVLGDFYKQYIWEDKPPSFYMRAGWGGGLKSLMENAYVVLFCTMPSEQISQVLVLAKRSGIVFDAVYRKRGDSPLSVQDYSQVIADFACPQVWVLVSVGLHSSVMNDRMCLDLISDSSMSASRKVVAKALPCQAENLTVLLLPNPRAQERTIALTFDYIANAICQILKDTSLEELGLRSDFIPFLTPDGSVGQGFCKCVTFAGSQHPKRQYQLVNLGSNASSYR